MRVLVPLDGSELAASILPDARRAAGRDGELVLVRDATLFQGTLWAREAAIREEQHEALDNAGVAYTASRHRTQPCVVRSSRSSLFSSWFLSRLPPG